MSMWFYGLAVGFVFGGIVGIAVGLTMAATWKR